MGVRLLGSRQVEGMTDAQINAALDKFIIDCDTQARTSIKRAGRLYSNRLKQNTPVDDNSERDHAKDNIVVSNIKSEGHIPYLEVGYRVRGPIGWYIHFPDGGTTVRGTVGQPPQHFIERTIKETERPVKALYRNGLQKAFDKANGGKV